VALINALIAVITPTDLGVFPATAAPGDATGKEPTAQCGILRGIVRSSPQFKENQCLSPKPS
jgi:hypothetical protein